MVDRNDEACGMWSVAVIGTGIMAVIGLVRFILGPNSVNSTT